MRSLWMWRVRAKSCSWDLKKLVEGIESRNEMESTEVLSSLLVHSLYADIDKSIREQIHSLSPQFVFLVIQQHFPCQFHSSCHVGGTPRCDSIHQLKGWMNQTLSFFTLLRSPILVWLLVEVLNFFEKYPDWSTKSQYNQKLDSMVLILSHYLLQWFLIGQVSILENNFGVGVVGDEVQGIFDGQIVNDGANGSSRVLQISCK